MKFFDEKLFDATAGTLHEAVGVSEERADEIFESLRARLEGDPMDKITGVWLVMEQVAQSNNEMALMLHIMAEKAGEARATYQLTQMAKGDEIN